MQIKLSSIAFIYFHIGISDRSSPAMGSSASQDLSFINNNDKRKVIGRKKIRREIF